MAHVEHEQAYILQRYNELQAALQEATDLAVSLELDLLSAQASRERFSQALVDIQPEVDKINRDAVAAEKFGPAVEKLKAELSPGGGKKPVSIG